MAQLILSLLLMFFIFSLQWNFTAGESRILLPKSTEEWWFFDNFLDRHPNSLRLSCSVICGGNLFLYANDFILWIFLLPISLILLVTHLFVCARSYIIEKTDL